MQGYNPSCGTCTSSHQFTWALFRIPIDKALFQIPCCYLHFILPWRLREISAKIREECKVSQMRTLRLFAAARFTACATWRLNTEWSLFGWSVRSIDAASGLSNSSYFLIKNQWLSTVLAAQQIFKKRWKEGERPFGCHTASSRGEIDFF